MLLVIVGPDTTTETENILEALGHGLERTLFLGLKWGTLMVLLLHWGG